MTQKFKQELSKVYKLGYSCGYKNTLMFITDFKKDKSPLVQRELDDLFTGLLDSYNNYPTIQKMVIDNLCGEYE